MRITVPGHAPLRLAPLPTAPADARRWAAAVIEDCGRQAERDDAMLLLSELVTNACRYSSDTITVSAECDDRSISFTVTDGASGEPIIWQPTDPSAERGRGMLLVAAIAGAWGFTPSPDGDGKSVWFRLP